MGIGSWSLDSWVPAFALLLICPDPLSACALVSQGEGCAQGCVGRMPATINGFSLPLGTRQSSGWEVGPLFHVCTHLCVRVLFCFFPPCTRVVLSSITQGWARNLPV